MGKEIIWDGEGVSPMAGPSKEFWEIRKKFLTNPSNSCIIIHDPGEKPEDFEIEIEK